ncbi:MAG: tetratricopeptide repeat protein [Candidatus Krumholzibacteriota bacterium]
MNRTRKNPSLRVSAAVVAAGLLCLMLAGGCAKKVTTSVGDEPYVPTGDQFIDHTLADGESLAQVADNYYGDPALAERIARDNKMSDPDLAVPGSLLRLWFDEDEWKSARQRSAALVPYNKGVDLLGKERLAEAEKQFRVAMETAPDLVAAKYNLALVLLKRGKSEQALVLLEELAVLRPGDIDFLFAGGNALFQSTRFDDAAVRFQAALDIDPQFQRAAFGLARSLQEGQHPEQAIAAWQRYLELDGTSSWAAAARRHLKTLQDEKLMPDDGDS